MIDHTELSKFRSSLTFSQLVNLMVYMLYHFYRSDLLGDCVIHGIDSTELANECKTPLASIEVSGKKIRIYHDLDCDCGKRRNKRDKSPYVIGYRLHTLTAINAETGHSYPLISLLAPANHHDSNFLLPLLKLAQAIGINIKLVTADEAYHDGNGAFYEKTRIHVTTPPSAKVALPEHVNPDTLSVFIDDMCEIPMCHVGYENNAHEYKCGAYPGECFRSGNCPQFREIPAAKAAESVLLRTLIDRHFDLVDPGISLKLHNDVKSLLKADTIDNAAAKRGLDHHAEIVLFHSVKAEPAGFDGMMETASVNIRVKIIITTTAQILFADEKSISGIGESADLACLNAARRAAENIAPAMVKSIVSWWADYTANGLPYTIALRTGKNADRLVFTFQDAVESIPRVISLTEKSSCGGITEMMVRYKGGSSEFKRAIFKRLKHDKRFANLKTEGSKGRFLALSVMYRFSDN